MSSGGPAEAYLEALGRELGVHRRYRRRVLAEIQAHIEDMVEREQRYGLSAERRSGVLCSGSGG